MKSPSSRGVSLSMIMVGVAAIGAATAAVLTSPSIFPAPSPRSTPNAENTNRPVSSSTLLIEANLSPDALAASGLSLADVTALAVRAKDHLSQHTDAIQRAIQAHTEAKKEVQRLEQLVRAGEDGTTAQTLHSARIVEEQTRSAKNIAVARLYAASTTGVAESHLEVLQSVNAQRRSGLPLEFLTSTRKDADIVSLRTALADQRIALRERREVPAEALVVINNATDDRVRTAQANLQNLAAYRETWRTTLASE